MPTDNRQHAIARVRSFFEPPTQFVSGVRIYEPEPADSLASKKRAIMSFAVKTAGAFESGKLHIPTELAALEKKLNEYCGCIDDAEAKNYGELLRALRELIAIGAKEAPC